MRKKKILQESLSLEQPEGAQFLMELLNLT